MPKPSSLKHCSHGAKHVNDCKHEGGYPLLQWVRDNPAHWAAKGWREKPGKNHIERIKK